MPPVNTGSDSPIDHDDKMRYNQFIVMIGVRVGRLGFDVHAGWGGS